MIPNDEPFLIDHVLILRVFGDQAGVANARASFKGRFPICIYLVLTDEVNSLQSVIELAIAARLRAKGYRLVLTSAAETPAGRIRLAESAQRFFLSLGEVNVTVSHDDPLKMLDAGDLCAVTPKLQGRVSDAIFIPDVRTFLNGPRGAAEHVRRYLEDEIVAPWHHITHFDRPFTPRPSRGRRPEQRLRALMRNLNQLVDEVHRRSEFRPDIRPQIVSRSAPTVRRLYEHVDTLDVWSGISMAGVDGAKLDDLALIVDSDYPKLLTSIRELIAAGVISQVADRCYARPLTWAPSSMSDTSTSWARDEVVPFAGVIDPRIAEAPRIAPEDGSRGPLSIWCVFPAMLFGYANDDPEKCTAVRMIYAGEASLATTPPYRCVVLDPTAESELTESDYPRLRQYGLCVLDTAWYMLPAVSLLLENTRSDCLYRRLLLPEVDSDYYSSSTKTPTAAAAAYVAARLGESSQARRIFDLFEWGIGWKKIMRL